MWWFLAGFVSGAVITFVVIAALALYNDKGDGKRWTTGPL